MPVHLNPAAYSAKCDNQTQISRRIARLEQPVTSVTGDSSLMLPPEQLDASRHPPLAGAIRHPANNHRIINIFRASYTSVRASFPAKTAPKQHPCNPSPPAALAPLPENVVSIVRIS